MRTFRITSGGGVAWPASAVVFQGIAPAGGLTVLWIGAFTWKDLGIVTAGLLAFFITWTANGLSIEELLSCLPTAVLVLVWRGVRTREPSEGVSM